MDINDSETRLLLLLGCIILLLQAALGSLTEIRLILTHLRAIAQELYLTRPADRPAADSPPSHESAPHGAKEA